MTTEEFREDILLKIFGVSSVEDVKTYELTEKIGKKSIKFLSSIIEIGIGIMENHQISTFHAKHAFDWVDRGTSECLRRDNRGCKIFGDFFGLGDIKDVEQVLTGLKYDKSTLQEAVETIDIKKILWVRSKHKIDWNYCTKMRL